jgi:HEAT repeat protein
MTAFPCLRLWQFGAGLIAMFVAAFADAQTQTTAKVDAPVKPAVSGMFPGDGKDAPLVSPADEPVLFVDLEGDIPIAKLLALARRPEQNSARTGYDKVRCEALRLLVEQPKGPSLGEKAIKDALLAALSAEQPQVRNAGAIALARRGYRSEIPRLFSMLEADPQAFLHFYRALESPQKDPPPLALFRKGLHSPNAAARAAVAEAACLCRAKALTSELQHLTESDTDSSVRDQAAIALALLGVRGMEDALLRLRDSGYKSLSFARALMELGGEEQVTWLLPLLWDKDPELKKLVAEGLGKMRSEDRETATLSLLVSLRDPSPEVRIASAQALASFREARAIPILREMLPETRDYSVEHRTALVQAVAAFGEELALPLLNDMLSWEFREECGLEAALAKFGHPFSGIAAWNAYVEDLEKSTNPQYLVREYTAALPIVSACADANLLKSIRKMAASAIDPEVKSRLAGVVETVAKRVEKRVQKRPEKRLTKVERSNKGKRVAKKKSPAKAMVAQRPVPQPPVPLLLPDQDNDGVPDARDKFPADPRRVKEDVPVRATDPVEKRLVAIPLRSFASDAPEPELLTVDDDGRAGYLVAETQKGVPVFRVLSTDGFSTRREWILSNPGKLAGIEKLVPAGMNARGTVVGTAIWKTEAIAGDAAGNNSRLAPACGFVFKDGKLKLSAAPPFSAATPRSAFMKINQNGEIFGHREERITDAGGDHIRIVAFFGDHAFRDVPPFEVTTITEEGCLLGYRDAARGRESFIWNGSRFMSIDDWHGLRLPLRAVGMNSKLQVVGNFEKTNQGRAFFWGNGELRPLAALIPGDQGIWLKSMVPLKISDSGNVIFTAEPLADGGKPAQKQYFELTLREVGENILRQLRFD